MKKSKAIFLPLLILFLSLPTIFPLLQRGFFAMHDDTQVPRVFLMARSLMDGMFPVRWVEYLGYGYGYPIFNFYAPLPYYVGGLFSIITGDPLLATKLVFIFSIIGAGLSMYYFIRKFFGEIPGIVAAISYVYFPYHAVNIYVRGALSELSAYVFLPLFWTAFYSLYYTKKKQFRENLGSILLLGVSLAFVLLSHNLSAYMLLLFTSLFGVIGIFLRKEKVSFILVLFSGLGLGILLTAFYWLPAIVEMHFTDVASQIGGGSDFRDHFVCLSEFWKTNWGYTGSVPGCSDGMSLTLGKSTILLLPLIFITLWYFSRKKALATSFLILTSALGLLLAFFLMLPVSQVVWEIIPGMEYLQFPWRFLNFFSLFFAVLLGACISIIKERLLARIGYVLAVGVMLVTISLYTRLFVPQELFPRDAAFYTDPTYIGFTVTKRSDEYLPASFVPLTSIDEIPQKKLQVPAFVTVTELRNKTGEYSAELTSSVSAKVQSNIAVFPAWQVSVDNKEVPVVTEKRGFSLQIPPGTHTVKAVFRQTQVEVAGNVLSFVGLLGLFLGIIGKQRYENRKTS